MATGLQAALLLRFAPNFVSEPFIASRLGGQGQHNYGALPRGADCKRIIERGMPHE
jgi:putative acyl-CoA dehydrogenase